MQSKQQVAVAAALGAVLVAAVIFGCYSLFNGSPGTLENIGSSLEYASLSSDASSQKRWRELLRIGTKVIRMICWL